MCKSDYVIPRLTPAYCRRGRCKMDILIVDNNKAMRRVIRLIVTDLVGEIYECGDGSEALAAYAAHLPDWVLMDIRMKNMDGLRATRELKAAYPDACIIIVTVCAGEDMRAAARAAGAAAYVVKDNLLELRQILSDRQVCKASQSLAS